MVWYSLYTDCISTNILYNGLGKNSHLKNYVDYALQYVPYTQNYLKGERMS